MLDSLGVEVFTIEMQVKGDIFKSDIMREPVAFKKIDTTCLLYTSISEETTPHNGSTTSIPSGASCRSL